MNFKSDYNLIITKADNCSQTVLTGKSTDTEHVANLPNKEPYIKNN